MFEHWSEHRRRWFLLTLCAAAWVFFVNALAQLGPEYARGGIGGDAVHAASLVGNLAIWTMLASTFRLRMRYWVFAALFGTSIAAAVVDFGLRDHAAAAIWDQACDDGAGYACLRVAEYYGAGRSVMHGGIDAEQAYHRACELGVEGPDYRCLPTVAAAGDACIEGRSRSACLAAAQRLETAGDLEHAGRYYVRACQLTLAGDSLTACGDVLDSGFHNLRVDACDVVERLCPVSADTQCASALARCERVRSPHAGVR